MRKNRIYIRTKIRCTCT